MQRIVLCEVRKKGKKKQPDRSYNPGQRVGTRSKLFPSSTFNVDNQVIFALFVGKKAMFSNID